MDTRSAHRATPRTPRLARKTALLGGSVVGGTGLDSILGCRRHARDTTTCPHPLPPSARRHLHCYHLPRCRRPTLCLTQHQHPQNSAGVYKPTACLLHPFHLLPAAHCICRHLHHFRLLYALTYRLPFAPHLMPEWAGCLGTGPSRSLLPHAGGAAPAGGGIGVRLCNNKTRGFRRAPACILRTAAAAVLFCTPGAGDISAAHAGLRVLRDHSPPPSCAILRTEKWTGRATTTSAVAFHRASLPPHLLAVIPPLTNVAVDSPSP